MHSPPRIILKTIKFLFQGGLVVLFLPYCYQTKNNQMPYYFYNEKVFNIFLYFYSFILLCFLAVVVFYLYFGNIECMRKNNVFSRHNSLFFMIFILKKPIFFWLTRMFVAKVQNSYISFIYLSISIIELVMWKRLIFYSINTNRLFGILVTH